MKIYNAIDPFIGKQSAHRHDEITKPQKTPLERIDSGDKEEATI